MPNLIPYTLTFEQRSDYLYARVEAPEISATISNAYLRDIRAECDAHGYRRLMVDRQIPHVMSTAAFYGLANNSRDIIRRVKTAWINPFAENQEMLEFAMTVANNRGASYALFTNERDAEIWLRNEPGNRDPTSPPDKETGSQAWIR